MSTVLTAPAPDDRVRAVILGGGGYGAGELLRIFSEHPGVEISAVISSSTAGEPISKIHPHLLGFVDGVFESEIPFEQLAERGKVVVFAALPHGVSAESIQAICGDSRLAHAKIIDLSGDFRLSDKTQRQFHYPWTKSCESIASSFQYGLPELFRPQIEQSSRIANPGCFATACILGLAPLSGLALDGPIRIDANSGSSGAGRTAQAQFHHPEIHSSAFAYKILEHRHEPEILQAVSLAHGKVSELSFVPHVIPTARGILATIHVRLQDPSSVAGLEDRFRQFYANAPFVRVRSEAPTLPMVIGSNFCDLYVKARERDVVIIAALDNLVKGMVGQAIQNMNLIFGFPETTGLWRPSLSPI